MLRSTSHSCSCSCSYSLFALLLLCLCIVCIDATHIPKPDWQHPIILNHVIPNIFNSNTTSLQERMVLSGVCQSWSGALRGERTSLLQFARQHGYSCGMQQPPQEPGNDHIYHVTNHAKLTSFVNACQHLNHISTLSVQVPSNDDVDWPLINKAMNCQHIKTLHLMISRGINQPDTITSNAIRMLEMMQVNNIKHLILEPFYRSNITGIYNHLLQSRMVNEYLTHFHLESHGTDPRLIPLIQLAQSSSSLQHFGITLPHATPNDNLLEMLTVIHSVVESANNSISSLELINYTHAPLILRFLCSSKLRKLSLLGHAGILERHQLIHAIQDVRACLPDRQAPFDEIAIGTLSNAALSSAIHERSNAMIRIVLNLLSNSHVQIKKLKVVMSSVNEHLLQSITNLVDQHTQDLQELEITQITNGLTDSYTTNSPTLQRQRLHLFLRYAYLLKRLQRTTIESLVLREFPITSTVDGLQTTIISTFKNLFSRERLPTLKKLSISLPTLPSREQEFNHSVRGIPKLRKTWDQISDAIVTSDLEYLEFKPSVIASQGVLSNSPLVEKMMNTTKRVEKELYEMLARKLLSHAATRLESVNGVQAKLWVRHILGML